MKWKRILHADEPGRNNKATTGPSVDEQVLADGEDYVAVERRHDEAAMHNLLGERFAFNASDGTTSDRKRSSASFSACASERDDAGDAVVVEGDIGIVFGTPDVRLAAKGGGASVSSLRFT